MHDNLSSREFDIDTFLIGRVPFPARSQKVPWYSKNVMKARITYSIIGSLSNLVSTVYSASVRGWDLLAPSYTCIKSIGITYTYLIHWMWNLPPMQNGHTCWGVTTLHSINITASILLICWGLKSNAYPCTEMIWRFLHPELGLTVLYIQLGVQDQMQCQGRLILSGKCMSWQADCFCRIAQEIQSVQSTSNNSFEGVTLVAMANLQG